MRFEIYSPFSVFNPNPNLVYLERLVVDTRHDTMPRKARKVDTAALRLLARLGGAKKPTPKKNMGVTMRKLIKMDKGHTGIGPHPSTKALVEGMIGPIQAQLETALRRGYPEVAAQYQDQINSLLATLHS